MGVMSKTVRYYFYKLKHRELKNYYTSSTCFVPKVKKMSLFVSQLLASVHIYFFTPSLYSTVITTLYFCFFSYFFPAGSVKVSPYLVCRSGHGGKKKEAGSKQEASKRWNDDFVDERNPGKHRIRIKQLWDCSGRNASFEGISDSQFLLLYLSLSQVSDHRLPSSKKRVHFVKRKSQKRWTKSTQTRI